MRSANELSRAERGPRRPRWWAWHQRLGLGFAAVFLVVIVTGVALNHTETLGLDRTRLSADWLYDWYDIELKGAPLGFAAGAHWVTQWDGQLLWNADRLGEAAALYGAIEYMEGGALVLTDDLWVLSAEGELLERLGSASLPAGIPRRIGRTDGQLPLVIETSTGRFASDADLLAWSPLAETAGVDWSKSGEVPTALRREILRANRGEDLTLNRLILDLHSGRFFGRLGVWVVDLAAVALAFLTLSGTWYAWRIKRRS